MVFKKRGIRYRDAVEILDKDKTKRIPLKDFAGYIKTLDQHMPVPLLELLAKRYTQGKSDFVDYE